MEKRLSRRGSAGAFAFSAIAAAASMFVTGAVAAQQEAPASSAQTGQPTSSAAEEKIETIYVTGSAIRRIKGETALPVQTIDSSTIEKIGVSSVADLVRRLPALQGSTVESDSIGGNSYGFAGASIHGLGENRTLVLINGRRMAQFGGQTLTGFAAAMDLNSIPVSAIERVEILTDGASALYGSDAVAGVVNFITKKKTTEGDATVAYYAPKGGAKESSFSVSKGMGDYDADGYNLFVTLGYDRRSELKAVERDFAKSSIVNFNYGGKRWTFFNGSPSSIPGNAVATSGVYSGSLVNPYYIENGNCPALTALVLDTNGAPACYFDHVTQIQIYPERERRMGTASFSLKLNEDNRFFTDVLFSRNEQTAKIAPVPGGVPISADSAAFQDHLAGLTGPDDQPIFAAGEDTVAYYRVFDMGPRTSNDKDTFYQVAAGFDGRLFDIDYDFALTQSESKVKGYISGYPGALAFSSLLSSGLIDPFVGPGQQSTAGVDGLQAISYRGYWDGGISRMQTAELKGSAPLFDMPNGNPVSLAAGLNYFKEKFQSKPSQFAQANLDDPVAGTPAAGGPGTGDQRFGDASASIPYSANRNVWGAFAELLIPVTDNLELGASVRRDDYDDFGSTTNYKGSFKFTPIRNLLFRGSYGTGFKAPTVPQLNAALQSYGVTSAAYDCTPDLQAIAQGLGAQCRPNNTQYDVFAGGNKDLQPEESKQATAGFIFEPVSWFSFGADYWWVHVTDTFGQISQGEAFANPNSYPSAWTTAHDVATGIDYLAYNQTNINTGEEYASGIDFDTKAKWSLPFGKLRSQLNATYLLVNKSQLQKGGQYYENIGDYSSALDTVAFRWQGALINTLEMGHWQHSVVVNYKSGYKDKETTVDGIDANGNFNGETLDVRLKVKAYVTVDLQSTWNVIDPLDVTVGALNVLDQDPPRSLTDANFPIGYDARYYDPRGRVLYGKLSYKF